MPLGDGSGPPDGSGPMTGRRRFGDDCPGATGQTSLRAVLIRVLAGVALAALTIALRRLTAPHKSTP